MAESKNGRTIKHTNSFDPATKCGSNHSDELQNLKAENLKLSQELQQLKTQLEAYKQKEIEHLKKITELESDLQINIANAPRTQHKTMSSNIKIISDTEGDIKRNIRFGTFQLPVPGSQDNNSEALRSPSPTRTKIKLLATYEPIEKDMQTSAITKVKGPPKGMVKVESYAIKEVTDLMKVMPFPKIMTIVEKTVEPSKLEEAKVERVTQNQINLDRDVNLDKEIENYRSQKRETLVFFRQSTAPSSSQEQVKKIYQTKLFEYFCVFSATRDEITNLEKKSETKAHLNPNLLYCYPEPPNESAKSEINSIAQFLTPRGIKVKKKKFDNQSLLPSIIFPMTLSHINEDCFVCPFQSFMTHDPTSNPGEFVSKTNPKKLRHAICIKVKDFIKLKDKKKHVWINDKIYCFITFYPMVMMFLDCIQKIREFIKMNRSQRIQKEPDLDYREIDSEFAIKLLKTGPISGINLEKELLKDTLNFEYLLNHVFPRFEILLSLHLFDHPDFRQIVNYQTISERRSDLLEAEWALSFVFGDLSMKDLLILYTAMLMEKKIFFLSKNRALLTGVLYTLMVLLKPMKYQGSILFMLPDSEYYFEMIDGIGFNFYGIDKNERYLFKKKIFQRDIEDSMFVCLDERKIYALEETLGSISFPLYDDFSTQLAAIYHKFHKSTSYTFTPIRITKDTKENSNKWGKKKSFNFINDANQYSNEDYFQIVDVFHTFFKKRILERLPTGPIYKSKEAGVLDMELIVAHLTKDNPRKDDVNLIEKLQFTQAFTTFLEEYYEAKEKEKYACIKPLKSIS